MVNEGCHIGQQKDDRHMSEVADSGHSKNVSTYRWELVNPTEKVRRLAQESRQAMKCASPIGNICSL